MSARISYHIGSSQLMLPSAWGKNMSIKTDRKTDNSLKSTVQNLTELSRLNSSEIWRDIARRLAGGRRRYASINLGKIDSLASDGDVLVVPGSILGAGSISKKLTISSLHISQKALEKIRAAGCTYKTIDELSKENPKGSNIKIMR